MDNPLLLLIAGLGFIFFLWIAQGGATSPLAFGGPFITAPETDRYSESYGFGGTSTVGSIKLPSIFGGGGLTFSNNSASNQPDDSIRPVPGGLITNSTFSGKIILEKRASGAKRSEAKDEYLVITAPKKNVENISITGFTLVSARTGRIMKIPGGTELPLSGTINESEAVVLKPGDKAYILSSRSPIGASFRINKCIGYFEQYQNFTPSLPNSCPKGEDELELHYSGDLLEDEACTDFVDDIPRCTLNSGLPPTVSYLCKQVITEYLGYNGCVRSHQHDEDFYSKEWRVYLGGTGNLWRDERETIRLLDPEGNLVDQFSY